MISKDTGLKELAGIVSDALERHGILATLSGGAAVSIYTDQRYASEDLDFVTLALVKDLKSALEPLGFEHTGSPRLSVFDHPNTRWYLEFPPAPISFGGTYIDPSQCALIDTGVGKLRIITPTHSVMDRLIAAAAWSEPQSLEQALLVADLQKERIDWKQLDEFVTCEGIRDEKEVREFYRKTNRPPPEYPGI